MNVLSVIDDLIPVLTNEFIRLPIDHAMPFRRKSLCLSSRIYPVWVQIDGFEEFFQWQVKKMSSHLKYRAHAYVNDMYSAVQQSDLNFSVIFHFIVPADSAFMLFSFQSSQGKFLFKNAMTA